MTRSCLLPLFLFVVLSTATVYFKETFDQDWESRWISSSWKGSEAGAFKHTAGEWYGDAEKDKGIMTSEDARFYTISSKAPAPFSNEGTDLVLQFSVKHTQKIDCGGGYIKILPSGLDQANFKGDSPYNIMFGPDYCGTATKKVHVIFTYEGKNLLTKKVIPCEADQLTHVYTLIVRSDNTYEVRIDNVKKESGELEEDWEFLLPKQIQDPAASKPADWVDEAEMYDPEDVKPEGYDDIPAKIPDPDAVQPEEWDEEEDGEYETPLIDNPEYKGPWVARMIPNPAYTGPWEHPMIDNPDYVSNDKLYLQENMEYVGFELWQVKSGTIFDNILVTDSVAEAEAFFEETYTASKDEELRMFEERETKIREEEEAKRKEAEALRAEQEAQKASEEGDDDDEGDDDVEDEDEAPGHEDL